MFLHKVAQACQLMGFCGYSDSVDPITELLQPLNTCQLLKVDPE
jgi:hypothetical protein